MMMAAEARRMYCVVRQIERLARFASIFSNAIAILEMSVPDL